MRDYDLKEVEDIVRSCAAEKRLTGDPFVDGRANLDENKSPYYQAFYYIAQALEPGLTVELGGWQGTAAAHFAAGNPLGVVATIDHHTDPGDDAHRAKMLEAVQHYQNLLYFQGWTWDKLVDVKALGKPVDVLFIDSWHQYEYAMRDWNDYSPLLSDGALVIADDLLSGDGPVIAGMRPFWNEIRAGHESFLNGQIHPGYPMGFIKYGKG